MDLPAPWRGFKQKTGRTDFYHPGTGETRQKHPMFTFFNELVAFLRQQAKNDEPMAEPLTAQIFREASPQFARERLGVWEGPFDAVKGSPGGATYYDRLLPGTDSACVESDYRRDDPRTEAAGNILARFDAWYHLWNGFCPDESFPFAESRISTLVAQLSEAVVIRPGDRADKETVLHQWNWNLERRSPLVPEMQVPLTDEEEKVQHEVTGLLGAAYGVALAVVAAHEAPYTEATAVTNQLMKSVYRSTGDHDIVAIEEKTEYSEEDEFEKPDDTFELDEEAEKNDYEESEDESVAEPVVEDEPADMLQSKQTVESAISGPSAAEAQEDMPDDEEAEADAQTARSRAFSKVSISLGEQSKAEEDDLDVPPVASPPPEEKEVELFLALHEPAESWAEHAMRPLTPPASPRPRSPQRTPMQKAPKIERRAKGFDEDLWASRNFLKNAGIKPFVSNLGWTCHLEIMKGMWSEDKAAAPAADDAPGPEGSQDQTPASAVPEEPAPTKFRGMELPPVALQQIRESTAAEIDSFCVSLQASDSFFDKCTSGRVAGTARSEAPLVQPHLDIDRPRERVHDRSLLVRTNIPSREKATFSSASDAPCEGCVPPPMSPANQVRTGLTSPPHLQGQLTQNKWGSSGRGRPRSADRLPGTKRSLRMRVAPRVSSADGRVRKNNQVLIEDAPDIPTKMAAEKIKHFLSRKCGRIETAFEQLDKSKNGFITVEDWEKGLAEMEYDQMEYARAIFKILDIRQHRVLVLSDITGRKNQSVYDGSPESEPGTEKDVEDELTQLLCEVLDSEMKAIVREAMLDAVESALRCPQPPIKERPDVVGWLKSRKKQKPKAKAKGRNQQQAAEQESASDVEAEVLENLIDVEPKEAAPKSSPKKKKGKQQSMPKPGGESSEGESERSSRAPSASRTKKSPNSSRADSMSLKSPKEGKKVKKPAVVKRKQGVMAMMINEGANAAAKVSAADEVAAPESGTEADEKPRAKERKSSKSRKKTPSREKEKTRASSEERRKERDSSRSRREEGEEQTAKSRKQERSSSREVEPARDRARERTSSRDQAVPPKRVGRSGTEERQRSESPSDPGARAEFDMVASGDEYSEQDEYPSSSEDRPMLQRQRSQDRKAAAAAARSAAYQDGLTLAIHPDSYTLKIAGPPAGKTSSGDLRPFRESRSGRDDRDAAKAEQRESPKPLHEQNLSLAELHSSVSKPVPAKSREVRVVQIGRRGNDGLVSSSSPSLQMQIGGSKPSSGARPRSQFLGGGYPQPAPQQAWDDSQPTQPETPPRLRASGGGHNCFDVGYKEPRQARKPEATKLPYVPRGPEGICKTYAHIFKLMNDPHAKKHLPKKKVAVSISMPRLPSAGASIVGSTGSFGTEYPSAFMEDDAGTVKMVGSKSMPSFASDGGNGAPSSGTVPAWQVASMRSDVEGAIGPERVQLPPLAKSR